MKNGGVLVSSFKSFVADEYLSVYPDTQPHRLHRCFGMSYNQFTEPGRMTLNGEPVQYFAELLKTDGAECLAHYEHKYWSQYAGITRHSYGNGHAYYVGGYTTKENLKKVYEQAAKDARISQEAMCSSWPVIVRSGTNDLGKVIHYVLHYSEENGNFICPFAGVKELLSGTVYYKGDSIPLDDWDVKILEEI